MKRGKQTMKYYNLDEIKTTMRKDIERTNAIIKAWENVSFPTKKDGSPFANMSKNISGAKYVPLSYAMQGGEYELEVFTNCRSCGYVKDNINVYELVCYLKDENKIAKKENYLPKVQYLNQVYKFDLDDIKQAVSERIDYLKAYVNDLENQLSKVDEIFYNFRNAYDKAMKQLESDTSEFSHKDAYYAVLDCVKERYPYI